MTMHELMSVDIPIKVDVAPPSSRLLLTVEEAAQALSVGRSLLYELLMRREIFSVKVGRVRRVPVDALRAYIARQMEAMPARR